MKQSFPIWIEPLELAAAAVVVEDFFAFVTRVQLDLLAGLFDFLQFEEVEATVFEDLDRFFVCDLMFDGAAVVAQLAEGDVRLSMAWSEEFAGVADCSVDTTTEQ